MAKPQPKTMSKDWSRRTASEAALKSFSEAFTKEVGGVASRGHQTTYEVVPTGSLALDAALGIGGWPRGRISMTWGPEHAGKTSLALLTVAEAQKKYPEQAVGWIDMEQTYDSTWAKRLGVDLNRLVLFTPETAEDTADAMKRYIGSGLFSTVVLDSVGGMISRAEMEKESDEAVMAKVAAISTRMVKIAAPIAHRNGTCVHIVNQVRANLSNFGAATQASGGWALKHMTSIQISVRKGGDEPKKVRIRGDEVAVGHQVACRVEKNKTAPYGATAKFWLYNRETEQFGPVGVNQELEIIEVARRWGVLPSTAWMTFPDGTKVQGADAGAEHLKANPELAQQMRAEVLEAISATGEDGDGSEQITEQDLEDI